MLAGLIHDIGYLPILTWAEDYPALLENEAALESILSTVANLQSYLGSLHPLAPKNGNNIPVFAKLGLTPETNVLEMEETVENIR